MKKILRSEGEEDKYEVYEDLVILSVKSESRVRDSLQSAQSSIFLVILGRDPLTGRFRIKYGFPPIRAVPFMNYIL